MKTCFKCSRELPLEEFYRHPQMGDGHLNKCKECTKADVTARRRANIDHYREYDRRRFHEDPERRAAQYLNSSEMKYLYPEKYRARYTVHNAIRDGRLERKPCEACGTARSEAHHEDYSRPLDVRWLCRVHHEAVHHAA